MSDGARLLVCSTADAAAINPALNCGGCWGHFLVKLLLLQWEWHQHRPHELRQILLMQFQCCSSSKRNTHQQGWLAKLSAAGMTCCSHNGRMCPSWSSLSHGSRGLRDSVPTVHCHRPLGRQTPHSPVPLVLFCSLPWKDSLIKHHHHHYYCYCCYIILHFIITPDIITW